MKTLSSNTPVIPRPNRVKVVPRCGLPTVIPPVELTRNQYGVIIDSFGDVSNARQCITINATAHRLDREGFTEQEIIRLTVPLTGPVGAAIRAYISVMLPEYSLHEWCVWPGDELAEDSPF